MTGPATYQVKLTQDGEDLAGGGTLYVSNGSESLRFKAGEVTQVSAADWKFLSTHLWPNGLIPFEAVVPKPTLVQPAQATQTTASTSEDSHGISSDSETK